MAELRERIDDERDRAFASACVYGVLRHRYSLGAALAQLVRKPLRRKDADIEALLLAGLYQVTHMQVPAHAIDASVEAARGLRKRWACGLVNAVLRRALDGLPDPAPDDEQARYEHPAWLIERVRADWPQDWQGVLAANNAQAPLTLRVNAARGTREAWLAELAAAGHPARPTRHAPHGVRLERACAVETLPGYADGRFSVQDEAAQLAAGLLRLEGATRVLDACAAPGGKTAHILELAAPGTEVVALDRDAQRMADVAGNLARLGLACTQVTADAAATDTWWDGRPFERILLDAPCSATGVIRRHPDIRLHRRADDITALAQTQARLLAALWPLLAAGGSLLYATCSILAAENDACIAAFVAANHDAAVDRLDVPWGRATALGRQVLPGEDDMDGFFYARLSKCAPTP